MPPPPLPPGTSDIKITKSASVATRTGRPVTYTLKAENVGPRPRPAS